MLGICQFVVSNGLEGEGAPAIRVRPGEAHPVPLRGMDQPRPQIRVVNIHDRQEYQQVLPVRLNRSTETVAELRI